MGTFENITMRDRTDERVDEWVLRHDKLAVDLKHMKDRAERAEHSLESIFDRVLKGEVVYLIYPHHPTIHLVGYPGRELAQKARAALAALAEPV